jgi:hypothetical protein
MAHSVLGASKAHRWITCPGSVALEATFPDDSSWHASEGTAAHTLAEYCLSEGNPPEKYLNRELNDGFRVTDEMVNHIATYVDFINGMRGVKHFEVQVSYEQYAPGGFGTADAVIINEGVLHVVDLKYGQGVKVSAKNNAQLRLYALGAFLKFGFDAQVDLIEMTIVQPRLDHIETVSLRVSDLLKWAKGTVAPAAYLAMRDDAPFSPSESACRFCKAKGTCRALTKKNLEAVQGHFENLDEALQDRAPHTLSADELAEIIPQADLISLWAAAVKEYATNVIRGGGVIPGYKIVEGRSIRRWANEDDAAYKIFKRLGQQAFTSKLKSPAQVEKLLGRSDAGEIADLIVKPKGKPTLAPEADSRPALESALSEMFGE